MAYTHYPIKDNHIIINKDGMCLCGTDGTYKFFCQDLISEYGTSNEGFDLPINPKEPKLKALVKLFNDNL